jgi:hypothetical protein
VALPHLGIAALPLKELDYLVTDAVEAAVITGSGVLVNVPSPGPFAFHKLWVSAERPSSESTKARKDIRQATQILEVLAEDRPDEVTRAYEALAGRRSMLRQVRAQLRRVDSEVMRRVAPLIDSGR